MGEIMNSPRGVKSGQSEHFLAHMWHPSRFTTNNWKTLICYIHVIAVIFCSEDLFWFQSLYWSRDIPHGIFRLFFVIGEFAQGQILCVFPNGLVLTMYSLPNYVLSSSLCTLVLTMYSRPHYVLSSSLCTLVPTMYSRPHYVLSS